MSADLSMKLRVKHNLAFHLGIAAFSLLAPCFVSSGISIAEQANPTAASEAKAEGEKSGVASLKDSLGQKGGSKDAPLYIKSDTLSLDSKGRVFTYRKNVEVKREDLTITADLVEGRYDDANKIQTLLATGNVVITRGEGLKATANRAKYFVPAARIELTEAPELYRNGNALAADKVTVFVNEDRSEAEGNVRVKVLKDSPTSQAMGGG